MDRKPNIQEISHSRCFAPNCPRSSRIVQAISMKTQHCSCFCKSSRCSGLCFTSTLCAFVIKRSAWTLEEVELEEMEGERLRFDFRELPFSLEFFLGPERPCHRAPWPLLRLPLSGQKRPRSPSSSFLLSFARPLGRSSLLLPWLSPRPIAKIKLLDGF